MEGGVNEGGGRPASATSNGVTTVAGSKKSARWKCSESNICARDCLCERKRERETSRFGKRYHTCSYAKGISMVHGYLVV